MIVPVLFLYFCNIQSFDTHLLHPYTVCPHLTGTLKFAVNIFRYFITGGSFIHLCFTSFTVTTPNLRSFQGFFFFLGRGGVEGRAGNQ